MQFEPLIEEVSSEDENERSLDKNTHTKHMTRTNDITGLLDTDEETGDCIVNVHRSRHVRVGPTIISVTHNESVETVRARFLCLNLETVKQAKRLRCSVAVCACWTTVVSVMLAVYFYLLLINNKFRLDIGLNETWYIRRDGWLAQDVKIKDVLALPVQYVVIANTEHSYCDDLMSCKHVVWEMQSRELEGRYGDIVPNFLVGGNGWVFEGRGANVVGFLLQNVKTKGIDMKSNSITISFIGNYGRETPDENQFVNVKVLLKTLVQRGILKEQYTLFGYCQLALHVDNPGLKLRKQLGLGPYLKKVWKGTTNTERASIFFVQILIVFLVFVTVYYELKIAKLEEDTDSLYLWYQERGDWMAREPKSRGNATTSYEPLRLVVIHHTVTHECLSFIECATAMKELQGTFLNEHHMDTPYNFFIGNDGRVYEGRGWGVQGTQCLRFNRCALVIGFFGDYRKSSEGGFSQVTDTQLENTLRLLNSGVQAGHLHKDYVVAGAKDLITSQSPGYYLYNAIKNWKHYDGGRYKELTCDQIHLLKSNDELDKAPHEWRIGREMWEAKTFEVTKVAAKYEPIRLVIVQDTISTECHSYVICKIEIQNMQTWFEMSDEDIPYNFIIGNEGRAYEARGWGIVGDYSGDYNNCSLNIGFVGDYSEDSNYNSTVTAAMLNRTQLILDEGVRLGHLHPDYVVLGAKDMFPSKYPGSNLYNVVRTMGHYDSESRYRRKTCGEIATIQASSSTISPTTTTLSSTA